MPGDVTPGAIGRPAAAASSFDTAYWDLLRGTGQDGDHTVVGTERLADHDHLRQFTNLTLDGTFLGAEADRDNTLIILVRDLLTIENAASIFIDSQGGPGGALDPGAQGGGDGGRGGHAGGGLIVIADRIAGDGDGIFATGGTAQGGADGAAPTGVSEPLSGEAGSSAHFFDHPQQGGGGRGFGPGAGSGPVGGSGGAPFPVDRIAMLQLFNLIGHPSLQGGGGGGGCAGGADDGGGSGTEAGGGGGGGGGANGGTGSAGTDGQAASGTGSGGGGSGGGGAGGTILLLFRENAGATWSLDVAGGGGFSGGAANGSGGDGGDGGNGGGGIVMTARPSGSSGLTFNLAGGDGSQTTAGPGGAGIHLDHLWS